MENTKREEFASGVQQLERNQDDFEKVLRQPAAPPTYAQSFAPAPAPAPILSTNNVIVTVPQSAPVVIQNAYEPKPDNGGALCFACCVFWCCCWPLGLAAFIVAVMAQDQRTAEDTRKQLRVANNLSVAGLVCGIVLIILIAVVRAAAGS